SSCPCAADVRACIFPVHSARCWAGPLRGDLVRVHGLVGCCSLRQLRLQSAWSLNSSASLIHPILSAPHVHCRSARLQGGSLSSRSGPKSPLVDKHLRSTTWHPREVTDGCVMIARRI